ncbi:MAG: hypothetical protein WCH76_02185 [Candidatus Riflemargulisbacteria bacterium]
MVNFNDMKSVQGYSNSNKKMEEEALLQRLIDKKLEQKNQSKNLQEAMQSQKAADAQKFEGIKNKYENQFKALEQISKQLNVKVQDLSNNLIKQAVNNLDSATKEIVQNIIKQDQLAQLKQEHQNNQLKSKGVEQQFTKEMQLMESIAKSLRIPVDQLTAGDVQKFMQILKKTSGENVTTQDKLDQIAKELGIPKEQINTKDIQKLLDMFKKEQFSPRQQVKEGQTKQVETQADSKLNKLETRQEDIQKILDKLKVKQEETLNRLNGKDQESQKVLEKQVGTLQGKMQQLEQSLQQLNGQIKKTLDKDKKAELEDRKSGLESQVKELKSSLKELQGQRDNSQQVKGKYDRASTPQEELNQIQTRVKELNNLEKELSARLEKSQDESKSAQIKEKIDSIKQEKEALVKQSESIAKDVKSKPIQDEQSLIQTKLKELNNLEKELTSSLGKAPDESKASQIKEKIDAIRQEKETLIQNKDIPTSNNKDVKKDTEVLGKLKNASESNSVKDSLIKEVTSKLEKMEADIKFREVYEKEINEQSSKDVKSKLLELKVTLKEVQTAKDGLKSLDKLSNQEKGVVLKQILGEIKNNQVKGNLENVVRQSVKATELINQIVSGAKTEITDAEAVLISNADLDGLGEEELNNLFKTIGDKLDQLKLSVRSIDVLKGSLKTEAKETQEKRQEVINTLRAVVTERSKGDLGVNGLRSLFNAGTLGQEAVDLLMTQFENLQTEDSKVQFVLLLRGLFGKDINALKMLVSLLVNGGKVEESFIEEEMGVLFTKEGGFEGEPVSKEALDALKKLTRMTPEMLSNNEGLQQMVQKGRIDREIFEKLFKKTVSEDAWDFGIMSFNKNKVGLLKERAEINSLDGFWKLMERFSSGGESETQEMAELFLTCKKFTNYQRELVSFFIDQYQEIFIDPDFHLFDLYQKYMDGNTFGQIGDGNREELCLAVMMRMVRSMEGPDKHQQFAKLIEMTKQKDDSLAFIRSVDVLEFYFSQGGIIKQEFLDSSKELKLFDSTTEWRDELKADIDDNTISKMISGFSKPVKQLESVKLGRLADRLKKK